MRFSVGDKQFGSEDVRRFVSRIVVNQDTGCWQWVGSKGPFRKGTFNAIMPDGTFVQVSAQSFAWAANHGSIARGQQVRTTCGNATCVNPDHLVLMDEGLELAATNALECVDLLSARIDEVSAVLDGLTGGVK